MNDKVTILVAEDSLTQAERIRATLEDHRFDVILARNGRQALALALERAPTLILSDIVMPEMDGYQLCIEVKKHHSLRDTPVMLLTSLSDPVDVVRGLECGADNFLVKPYDERYLISRISYMLANRHLKAHEHSQMGVEIVFAGNKYFITSDRLQILNLLLSTYETAVHKNRELIEVQTELKALAESLDEKVKDRTAQLQTEVDERRRAQDSLQHSVERERALSEQLQQAQKMEAIGRLAGGVAHDFNNLLSIIIGYSELLLEQEQLNESGRDLVHDVLKAGERAAALTAQLLAFSRKSIIRPRPTDINALTRDLQRMLHRLIGEDIDLLVLLDESLRPVLADPTQIEQVIMNLAVNARDAMPLGGKLIIETQALSVEEPFVQAHEGVKPGNYAMLAVTDNGMGMSDDVKVRIFEPFFTTKEVGKGTGLGLATIYGIVKQSNGHISVYSELGSGTTFKVYLPIAEHEEAFRRRPEPSSVRVSPTGTETILLVEDEEGVRKLSRLVLESYGYTVLEASNGRQAIDVAAAHEGPIHLLLTDVVMPKLNGRELAASITRTRPNTKVLFMSGYTDDAILHLGVLETDMPLLQKPFTPTVLARKVRDSLDRAGR